MNTKLVSNTLAQCTDSVSLILKDGENLSTQQALLLETVKQSLQLALEHIRNDRY